MNSPTQKPTQFTKYSRWLVIVLCVMIVLPISYDWVFVKTGILTHLPASLNWNFSTYLALCAVALGTLALMVTTPKAASRKSEPMLGKTVHIHQGEQKKEEVKASTSTHKDSLKPYLNWLSSQCNDLPSIGLIDVSLEGQKKLGLSDVYIDVTVQAFTGDKKRLRHTFNLEPGQESVSILEILKDQQQLVLLGDAGSGKTTFVNYLSYLLAKADESLKDHLKGKLPIRLVLRNLVTTESFKQAETGNRLLIWKSFKEMLTNTNTFDSNPIDQIIEVLKKAEEQGQLIIFLDGLDEVSESARPKLIESIQELSTLHQGRGNRYIVTARPYAYANPDWQLENYPVFTLNHFNQEQINKFIRQWYQRVGPGKDWAPEQINQGAESLIRALSLHTNIADQAKRPLLLTLIASMHSSRGRLPDDRAELYENSIDLFLERWQRQALGDKDNTVIPGLDLDILKKRMGLIRQALEQLAFETHKKQQQSQDNDEELATREADISKTDLLLAFRAVIAELPTNGLISFLQDRAGLLIPRDNDTYAFPHRSFQEYLAACYLEKQDEIELKTLIRADARWWKEVFLLTVGIKRNSPKDALHVISDLMFEDYKQAISDKGDVYRVIVAAQGLKELEDTAKNLSNYQTLNTRIQGWLMGLLTDLPIRDRVEAGDALAELGDPRQGVGIIVKHDQRLPDIDWVEIPAGSFMMGSEDPLAIKSEQPIHKVTFKRGFKLSRYCVTNAQYALFIEAGGYEQKKYWSDQGWGLTQRARVIPERWQNIILNQANQPVVGVCWYECEAYCRWLSEQLRTCGKLSERQMICLPSEAQWEYAARGPESLLYPWGDEWNDEYCNNAWLGLNRPVAVGLFTKKKSFFECEDMSGNVWEWCQEYWHDSYQRTPPNGQAWIDTNVNNSRILRGNSWCNGDPNHFRTSVTFKLDAGRTSIEIGFRICQDAMA